MSFYLNICFIKYLFVKIEGCDKSHYKIGNKHLNFSLLFVFYSFKVYSHIVSRVKIAKHFLWTEDYWFFNMLQSQSTIIPRKLPN